MRHLDILLHLDIDDDTYLGGEDWDEGSFLQDFRAGLTRATDYVGDGVPVDSIEALTLADLQAIARAYVESNFA